MPTLRGLVHILRNEKQSTISKNKTQELFLMKIF